MLKDYLELPICKIRETFNLTRRWAKVEGIFDDQSLTFKHYIPVDMFLLSQHSPQDLDRILFEGIEDFENQVTSLIAEIGNCRLEQLLVLFNISKPLFAVIQSTPLSFLTMQQLKLDEKANYSCKGKTLCRGEAQLERFCPYAESCYLVNEHLLTTITGRVTKIADSVWVPVIQSMKCTTQWCQAASKTLMVRQSKSHAQGITYNTRHDQNRNFIQVSVEKRKALRNNTPIHNKQIAVLCEWCRKELTELTTANALLNIQHAQPLIESTNLKVGQSWTFIGYFRGISMSSGHIIPMHPCSLANPFGCTQFMHVLGVYDPCICQDINNFFRNPKASRYTPVFDDENELILSLALTGLVTVHIRVDDLWTGQEWIERRARNQDFHFVHSSMLAKYTGASYNPKRSTKLIAVPNAWTEKGVKLKYTELCRNGPVILIDDKNTMNKVPDIGVTIFMSTNNRLESEFDLSIIIEDSEDVPEWMFANLEDLNTNSTKMYTTNVELKDGNVMSRVACAVARVKRHYCITSQDYALAESLISKFFKGGHVKEIEPEKKMMQLHKAVGLQRVIDRQSVQTPPMTPLSPVSSAGSSSSGKFSFSAKALTFDRFKNYFQNKNKKWRF